MDHLNGITPKTVKCSKLADTGVDFDASIEKRIKLDAGVVLKDFTHQLYGMQIIPTLTNNPNVIHWIPNLFIPNRDYVELASQSKVIIIVITQIMLNDDWFQKMIRFSSHIWKLDVGATYLSSNSIFCIVDFRSIPHSNPTIRNCPTGNGLSQLASKVEPPHRLGWFGSDFQHLLPRSKFNIDFLACQSRGVIPEGFRQEILKCLEFGFPSRYRGGHSFQRDFSAKLNEREAEKALDKLMAEVRLGHCIGPFNRCPFPNQWCDKQAIVCQIFLIPKHKWKHDGTFRLIANRSFPDGRSFNDLVERHDCKFWNPCYEYFTFQRFLSLVRKMGRNTLVSLFDIKDAYKNCLARRDELWQQVYRVKDKYFIDCGGIFGSRNAGDSWNLMMEFIVVSIRARLEMSVLEYFVDNGALCTPPLNSCPDFKAAERDFSRVLSFLDKGNIPYHDVFQPSTKVFFLGWNVDTDAMTVSATEERMAWLRSVTRGEIVWKPKLLASLVGVLEFLASVLPYVRAPLGWLQKRAVAIEQGNEKLDLPFRLQFQTYWRYVDRLIQDWDGTAPIRDEGKASTDPDLIIFADASGEVGYGAVEVNRRLYGYGVWGDLDFRSAMRQMTTSSTHFEILSICMAIRSFATPGSAIQINCDSQPAIFTLIKNIVKCRITFKGLLLPQTGGVCKIQLRLIFDMSRESDSIRLVDSLSKGLVSTSSWFVSFRTEIEKRKENSK